jgi:glycosyltransferase involved in cell wall biosynthesis
MRFGINCFHINPNYSGGINSYTFGLLDGFVKSGRDHRFQIYVTSRNIHLFQKYSVLNNFEIILLPDSKINKIFRIIAFASLSESFYKFICGILYDNICRLMDDKSDVIYIPTTFLFPYNFKKPTLVSLHDLQQNHFPQFFTKRELFNRKIHYGLTAKFATYIQASSQFVKDDILNHYKNIPEEQVIVISQGVNIDYFSQPCETSYLCDKYKIPEDFLLYPAQLWHHKNHITLLKSLNLIYNERHQKIPFVMTGKNETASDNIFNYIKENKLDFIYHLDFVPLEDLRVLYKKAKFLVSPSLFEASGLTILEAAASGTPIIASNIAPVLELADNLKLNIFKATDYKELADLIFTCWNDNNLISEQSQFNLDHISYYSWANVAAKYLASVEKFI